jgi:hypothetical protein
MPGCGSLAGVITAAAAPPFSDASLLHRIG